MPGSEGLFENKAKTMNESLNEISDVFLLDLLD